MLGRCPRADHHHPSPTAQSCPPQQGMRGWHQACSPQPLRPRRFFPIPTCLCCFSSFFSFSFSSFSLWQSSLEARSWEQGGD